MGLLQNIRHGKGTIRNYNQMRMSAAILGPFFILMGIAGFLGFGTLSVQGKALTGIWRIVWDSLLAGIGLLLCYLRLTILREKRAYDKNRS